MSLPERKTFSVLWVVCRIILRILSCSHYGHKVHRWIINSLLRLSLPVRGWNKGRLSLKYPEKDGAFFRPFTPQIIWFLSSSSKLSIHLNLPFCNGMAYLLYLILWFCIFICCFLFRIFFQQNEFLHSYCASSSITFTVSILIFNNQSLTRQISLYPMRLSTATYLSIISIISVGVTIKSLIG